jgi:hypothetical protein
LSTRNRTALPATRTHTYAFSAYYTAARLALQGQAGVRLCDEWFFEQQRALGFGNRADFFCPNPPTTALLMLPVAWLPPRAALIAWIACDVALAAAIVAIGWRVTTFIIRKSHMYEIEPQRGAFFCSADVRFAALAAIVIALYRPLHADLLTSQVYTLVALLYALWLYGYLTRCDWLCGAALAGLALAKLSGWPLWLLMLAGRRWRALVWALGLGLAGLLASLPLVGADFWRLFLFHQMLAIPSEPSSAVPANQTLSSLLRQCFVYDQRWSPMPLIDAPWLTSALWWVLTLALLGVTLAVVMRRPTAWTSMAAMCLVVPLQPAGEEYHYMLLLPVLLVLLAILRRPLALTAVLGAALLFALPAYFVDTAAFGGWPRALLAYPRMYGALLLWSIALMSGFSRESEALP